MPRKISNIKQGKGSVRIRDSSSDTGSNAGFRFSGKINAAKRYRRQLLDSSSNSDSSEEMGTAKNYEMIQSTAAENQTKKVYDWKNSVPSTSYCSSTSSEIELHLSTDSEEQNAVAIPKVITKQTQKRLTKFNQEWKSEFEWIGEHKDDCVECVICAIWIKISVHGKYAIIRHQQTKKHAKALMTKTGSVTAENQFDAEIAEASFCYVLVKHNLPYSAMDDVMDVMKETVKDSEIVKKMHCKRSKVTKVIENVIGPASVKDHITNIKTNHLPFGVQIDASNLHGNRKLFPVVITYWLNGLHYFVLDIVESSGETAKDLFDLLINSLSSHDLNVESVISYSADNASANFADYNSLFAYLKEINGKVLKGRCFAHILHNAFKHSMKSLNFNVEQLVLKVHGHFSKSAQRRETLAELNEEEDHITFKRHLNVRFLSLVESANNLLDKWDMIVDYFSYATTENDIVHQLLFMADNQQNYFAKITLSFIGFVGKMITNTIKVLERSDCAQVDLGYWVNGLINNFKTLKELQEVGEQAGKVLDEIPISDRNSFLLEVDNFYRSFIEYLEKYLTDEEIECQIELLSPFCLLSGNLPTISDCKRVVNFFDLKEKIKHDDLIQEILVLHNSFNEIKTWPEYVKGETSIEKWAIITKNKTLPYLNMILARVLSVTATSAFVERVFSIIKNKWTAERKLCSVKLLAAEVMSHINFDMSIKEFIKYVSKNVDLLTKIKSSDKY